MSILVSLKHFTVKEMCSLPMTISSSYRPTLSGCGQFLSSSLNVYGFILYFVISDSLMILLTSSRTASPTYTIKVNFKSPHLPFESECPTCTENCLSISGGHSVSVRIPGIHGRTSPCVPHYSIKMPLLLITEVEIFLFGTCLRLA